MPGWHIFHHYTVLDIEDVVAADKLTGASSKGAVGGKIHISACVDATRTEAPTDVSLVWIVSNLNPATGNCFCQRQCDEKRVGVKGLNRHPDPRIEVFLTNSEK